MDLVIYDDGSCDQQDGGGELADDQPFSQELAAGGIFEETFKDRDGVITGKDERRVDAGKESAADKKGGKDLPIGHREEDRRVDRSTGQVIEERADRPGDNQRKDQCEAV